MTIKEKLKLIKRMEEANIKSIERYLKRNESDSLFSIVRRESEIQSVLRVVVKDFNVDTSNGGED